MVAALIEGLRFHFRSVEVTDIRKRRASLSCSRADHLYSLWNNQSDHRVTAVKPLCRDRNNERWYHHYTMIIWWNRTAPCKLSNEVMFVKPVIVDHL